MDANLQKILSGMARCAGLAVSFAEGEPIRISGFQDGDSPFLLIPADQPDSELIFAVLLKIGLVATQGRELSFPWPFNRAYQNETAGEVVYRTRRTVRYMCNSGWRASLWALCAFAEIGRPDEFKDFSSRHPEKLKWMPLVLFGVLKVRCVRMLKKLFAILFP